MRNLIFILLAACATEPTPATHSYECSAVATCNGSKTTETLMSHDINDIWAQESSWLSDCQAACPGADVKVDAPSTAADSCVLYCGGN